MLFKKPHTKTETTVRIDLEDAASFLQSIDTNLSRSGPSS